MCGKALICRVQPILLTAGQIQSRSLSGEPFRQDEEIVLRRNGFFFAENGSDLRFMQGDRAALDRPAQITDARKARRARVAVGVSERAFHCAVPAHGKAENIILLPRRAKAEHPAAHGGQLFGDIGEIRQAVCHIGIKAALHLRKHNGETALARVPLHGGVARPAGTIVRQAMQKIKRFYLGEIALVWQYHVHRRRHAQRF